MEEHLIPENQKLISQYREDLKLDLKKYSDIDVWAIIKNTKWLARLYVNQYKHLSPKEILKKMEIRYNLNADNHEKTRSIARR